MGRSFRPRVVAIVPCGGVGKRLGLKTKKPLVLLGSKPLAAYALKALNDCKAIDAIIVAAERSCMDSFRKMVRKYNFNKVKDIVAGGPTRFVSVRNCLAHVDEAYDIVLIHDGARPFIDDTLIKRSIRSAASFGGCVVCVPECDTVKRVDNGLFIKKTLDRSRIVRAQTPQVFMRAVINKAYAACDGIDATDDSVLVEILGKRVKALKGSYRNIKITTKEDLKLAEVLL